VHNISLLVRKIEFNGHDVKAPVRITTGSAKLLMLETYKYTLAVMLISARIEL
jgi:hypothetical protein